MAFELEEFSTVKLTNMNPRKELHGPERVMAVDLNFTLDAPNSILSQFDGGLLSAVYYKTEASVSDQDDLEGVEPATNLPNLRFPKMSPIKWDAKHAGYTLCMDYGLGEKGNLELEGCEVGKFVLDCKEGGTVEVKFQVQCAVGLTERIVGKLALMIGGECQITLLAPQAAQPQLPMESPFPVNGKAQPLTAEQVFLQGSDAAAPVH